MQQEQLVLRFHVDLYPFEALERAAAAFGHLARFRIEAGTPHHRVTVEPGPSIPIAQLGPEFANHALAAAALARSSSS